MLTQITEQLLNGRTEKKKIYNYMRGHISTQCNKDLCYCDEPNIWYKGRKLGWLGRIIINLKNKWKKIHSK